ncbi:family 43 glycosylhydrolase [Arthrobacter sp. JZ12]|uniref:family 43 glycosylhydrolase n=1 Tax=Arthrobacter sp. JZ12 TaxID=2654190 RepID=UPI002B4AA5A5|nr:family 43 glycosylhydrolase [Arthrobacter sp. JZ12]WRH25337.1 family 43 glycosylhydrolase [Arthrobacter sp. JZ12]
MISNPMIRGFAPDPSILKREDTYYLANSSFEWYPRIPIHRSKDLVTWEYAGCLDGPDLGLTLTGVPDSGGIWAPSLSFSEGLFWLTFSVIYRMGNGAKELRTFVTTSEDIAGPWRQPTRVPGHGFDPSIFHHDGKHWLLNMQWDPRPGHNSFAGITLQQLNRDGTDVIGTPNLIHQREMLIEGPNLYYHDGWFHLMLAEGGTGPRHGIAMMRSRSVLGPYEPDPQHALLTTRDDPAHPLQKAGHGELVQTADGRWYLVHLASRWLESPTGPQSILGRETCIQEVYWNDEGWLRLAAGGWHPQLEITSLGSDEPTQACHDAALDADLTALTWPWSSLRRTISPEWADTSSRPGWLRLTGADSPDSLFEQSLIARRVTEHNLSASVLLDAEPRTFTQAAGLTFHYNTSAWFFLQLTWIEPPGEDPAGQQWNERGSYTLRLLMRDQDTLRYVADPVLLGQGPVRLHAELREGDLRFFWSTQDSDDRKPIGLDCDGKILSDDHGDKLRFTGCFVGIRVDDHTGEGFTADFSDFTYSAKEKPLP